MAQTKAQLVGGIGISTVSDLNVYGGLNATGIITATSFVGSIAGTAATFTNNVTVGSAVTINSGGVNVAGVVTATSFVGNGSGLTGAGSTVADDTVTNETFYPVFTQTTSGTITASKVSTSKLSFNPSTGTLSASNVSIAGTLTYEDVTNVDSIGIITARSGIVISGGDATLGTGVTISGATANTFTVSTNGSERVRVDSSGRLGIGTNPSSALFEVAGASAQFQNNVVLKASTHVTSRRVGISFNDDWVILQDIQGSGTKDFGIYSSSLATTIFAIDTSGNFGLGNVSPGAKLDVTGNIRLSAANPNIEFNNGGAMVYGPAGNTLAFATGGGPGSPQEKARISSTGGFSVGTTANPGAGAIYATGDITAFYSSDIRLKKDIEPIAEPIKKLMEITGVTYKWNEEYLKDKDVDGYFVRETEVGVIAQEVEKVLPEVVATRENGYKAVRYEKLVALLIEAVKDQQKQIDELRAQVEGK